jgi:hypothetical protein
VNKRERALQVYNLLRTSRLNVLYYEESLRNWTFAIRGHDVIVALTGAASPIAFLRHSKEPFQGQAWFYLTLCAGLAALLKPVLRLDKQIALYTELTTHYRELNHELKCVVDDMAYDQEFSTQLEKKFLACRMAENSLQKKEPPPRKRKVQRLQALVEQEFDMSLVWLPEENEEINDRAQEAPANAP